MKNSQGWQILRLQLEVKEIGRMEVGRKYRERNWKWEGEKERKDRERNWKNKVRRRKRKKAVRKQ